MIKQGNTSRRFILLLGVSLVLHIFILLFISQVKSINVISAVSQQASINVKLTQRTEKSISELTIPIKKIIKQTTIPVNVRKTTTIAQTQKHVQPKQIKQEELISTEQRNAINRAEILSKVQSKMHTYFYYPRIAQTKSWQGTVKLYFNFDKIGKINNIQIARSSGYSVLDDAAINALTKVKHALAPQALSLLNQAPYELTVVYQLQEG